MAGLPGVARWCRATSIGPPSSSALITTSSVPSWWRIHTVCPNSVAGSEYWQCSKVTMGVLSGTRRVTPSAAVWGRSGTACSAGAFLGEHLHRTPARGGARGH